MSESGPPVRVLIADDSSVVRERLVALLGELPEVVIAAETGTVQETVDSIRSLRPQVVVLDLSMPGGSGLDVLKQTASERLSAMTIVLTNYPYPEYEQKAREHGASAFFDKSHEFMKVVELVRDLSVRNRPVAFGSKGESVANRAACSF